MKSWTVPIEARKCIKQINFLILFRKSNLQQTKEKNSLELIKVVNVSATYKLRIPYVERRLHCARVEVWARQNLFKHSTINGLSEKNIERNEY